MALTTAQMQTLATALRAETDAGVVAAMAVRNDVALTAWCNSLSSVDAWNESVQSREMFEAMNITKFDNITAGKRDAWRVLMDFAPVDFGRQKLRKAIEDVWGAADGVAVLQAFVRKATQAEKYLGGTDATTNTVTAKKLNYTGSVSIDDVSNALNAF